VIDWLNDELTEHGAFAEGCFTHGLGWWIYPTIFGARLCVGSPDDLLFLDDVWCYDGFGSAYEAVCAWRGLGEPQGWHRHPRTGRRRPEGDRQKEYVSR
jgi:hypothetical protein